jgi:hypothetical protein
MSLVKKIRGLNAQAALALLSILALSALLGGGAKSATGAGWDEELHRLVELHRELGSPGWFRGVVDTMPLDAGGPEVGVGGRFLLPRWWVQAVERTPLWAVMSHEIAHLLDGRLEEALKRREEAHSTWGFLGARERSEASMEAELECDLEGAWIFLDMLGEKYYLENLWLGIDEIPLITQVVPFPTHPPRRLRWRALAAILY